MAAIKGALAHYREEEQKSWLMGLKLGLIGFWVKILK